MTMGLGTLGNNFTLPPKKIRWTLQADFPSGKSEPNFVRISGRPTLPEDLAGTIETTYYDLTSDDETGIFKIISSCYQLSQDYTFKDPSREIPEEMLGTLNLSLYDGVGVLMEEWNLLKVWPKQINFGNLDHTSSDTFDLDIIWRYNSFTYTNHSKWPYISNVNVPDSLGNGKSQSDFVSTSTGTENDSLSPHS
jgi:hypothetical protein